MSEYKNKRIAILGLSVEGRDSVKYFVKHEAKVLCCDRRSKEELGETYRELKKYPVSFNLGSDYLKNLQSVDLLVRTQGMALWTDELKELKKQGKKITSNAKLFLDICPSTTIGVTGTKGKGTTSTLIFEMLKKSGKVAYLGGNVGTPLLSQVDEMKPSDFVVLELSSFQLEDFHKSPHIAVILRITSDHLANLDPLASNYHADRGIYVEAKKPIVRFQKPGNVAIINIDDPTSYSFRQETPAHKYYFSQHRVDVDAYVRGDKVFVRKGNKRDEICDAKDIQLRGRHNLENISAASLAALACSVKMGSIRSVAKTFKGLEHRLELVKEIEKISYYNDSFSTVPDTAIAAVVSFNQPIILILGGSEKGSDFTQLGKSIAGSTVKTVILVGQMTQRILEALKKASYAGEIITGPSSMREIVRVAKKHAVAGDVVLLSPACASFDMFKNYKERGSQFKHEVALL